MNIFLRLDAETYLPSVGGLSNRRATRGMQRRNDSITQFDETWALCKTVVRSVGNRWPSRCSSSSPTLPRLHQEHKKKDPAAQKLRGRTFRIGFVVSAANSPKEMEFVPPDCEPTGENKHGESKLRFCQNPARLVGGPGWPGKIIAVPLLLTSDPRAHRAREIQVNIHVFCPSFARALRTQVCMQTRSGFAMTNGFLDAAPTLILVR